MSTTLTLDEQYAAGFALAVELRSLAEHAAKLADEAMQAPKADLPRHLDDLAGIAGQLGNLAAPFRMIENAEPAEVK